MRSGRTCSIIETDKATGDKDPYGLMGHPPGSDPGGVRGLANVRNVTYRAHILLLEMHSAVTPLQKRRSGSSFHLIRLA